MGERALRVDVGSVERPTLATVDALARLRLSAARLGLELRLRGAGDELAALLELAGLAAVLGVEVRRQPEEREEAVGAEEEGDLGDPGV